MRDRMLIVVYNDVMDNVIRNLLEEMEICGFTELEQVKGKGCRTGYALGTPVYPDLNNMLLVIEEADRLEALAARLKEMKATFPDEGLKLFTVPVQEL